jgi:hypothetical protein
MKKWIIAIVFHMERSFYLNLDLWYIQKSKKPLILRGARQVGKTFGVKDWIQKKSKNIIYLNFEKDKKLHLIFKDSLDSRILISKLCTYSNQKIDAQNDILFFDEIQLCGEALNSLKYFSEDAQEYSIIAAGSLLGLTLSNEPFPVGKVQFLDVYPMTFNEFLNVLGEQHLLLEALKGNSDYLHERLIEKMKHYLITGGAPEIVEQYIHLLPTTANDFAPLRKRQEELIDSYLADMAKHCGKINAMALERLWKTIPAQLAKKNEHTSRFTFKDVLPSKNKYSQMASVIDWLETAGLIYRIQIVNQGLSPLFAFTKESFFKLYLFDVGILNALSGLSPAEILNYDFGTFKGYLLENFVLGQLIKLFGKNIFTWTEGTSEVDFIREIEGVNVPIEVKAGINLKAKNLTQFISKYRTPWALRLSLQYTDLSKSTASPIKDVPIYLCGEEKVWQLETYKKK